MSKKKVIILGGGITGLVTAYYLSKKYKVILIEKERFLGGSARGFLYKDFILDYGPHKIYTELPGIIDEIKKVVPLLKVKKKNSIYLKRDYYDFPLKISQVATRMPMTALRACTEIITKNLSKLPDNSYENFLINRFGKTLYNLSFKDYAFKVWNSDPKKLDKELAKKRVAISGIFELIKGILFKDTKKISAEYFYYPEKGMKQLIDTLEKEIKKNRGKILNNAEINKIKLIGNKIDYIQYKKLKIKSDFVISTIPLDILVRTISPEIKEKFSKISYQKLNILYYILKKEKALKDCWIFFPELKFLFQRVSEQKAFSPLTSPKEKTAIMVETTQNITPKLLSEITSQLENVGVLKKNDIEEIFLKSIEKAYPVYKIGFMEELKKIKEYFDNIENFYLLGRQGLFNYNNMDQCWDMAMKVADQVEHKKTKEDWKKIRKYFDSYRIVD